MNFTTDEAKVHAARELTLTLWNGSSFEVNGRSFGVEAPSRDVETWVSERIADGSHDYVGYNSSFIGVAMARAEILCPLGTMSRMHEEAIQLWPKVAEAYSRVVGQGGGRLPATTAEAIGALCEAERELASVPGTTSAYRAALALAMSHFKIARILHGFWAVQRQSFE